MAELEVHTVGAAVACHLRREDEPRQYLVHFFRSEEAPLVAGEGLHADPLGELRIGKLPAVGELPQDEGFRICLSHGRDQVGEALLVLGQRGELVLPAAVFVNHGKGLHHDDPGIPAREAVVAPESRLCRVAVCVRVAAFHRVDGDPVRHGLCADAGFSKDRHCLAHLSFSCLVKFSRRTRVSFRSGPGTARRGRPASADPLPAERLERPSPSA